MKKLTQKEGDNSVVSNTCSLCSRSQIQTLTSHGYPNTAICNLIDHSVLPEWAWWSPEIQSTFNFFSRFNLLSVMSSLHFYFPFTLQHGLICLRVTINMHFSKDTSDTFKLAQFFISKMENLGINVWVQVTALLRTWHRINIWGQSDYTDGICLTHGCIGWPRLDPWLSEYSQD